MLQERALTTPPKVVAAQLARRVTHALRSDPHDMATECGIELLPGRESLSVTLNVRLVTCKRCLARLA